MPSPADDVWFSEAAYRGPGADYSDAPPGWSEVKESDPNPDGYYGVAFRNGDTGEIVVANRGSRPSYQGLTQDWLGSDPKIAAQGALGVPAAFQRATEFGDQVQAEFPGAPMHFTGHSLGGAEAQVQAAEVGGTATTFGAPGAAFAVDSDQAKSAANSVTNYVLPGDVIGGTGSHIGKTIMLSPAGATLLKSGIAGGAGLLIGGPLGTLIALVGVIIANHPLGNYEAALAESSEASPDPASGGGMPAARLTDMHVCPMVTGVVPHVGGPIIGPGAPTVMIGGLPAARIGDMIQCLGPPDVIVKGSTTVIVSGMPQARILVDNCAHGGVVVTGCFTVLVGG